MRVALAGEVLRLLIKDRHPPSVELVQIIVEELHRKVDKAVGEAGLAHHQLLFAALHLAYELLLLHLCAHQAAKGGVFRHVQQHLHHVFHSLWPEQGFHELFLAFFHGRRIRTKLHSSLLLHVHEEGLDLLLSSRLVLLHGPLKLAQEGPRVPGAVPFLERERRCMLFKGRHILLVSCILLVRLALLHELLCILVEDRQELLEDWVHVLVESFHGESAKSMRNSLLRLLHFSTNMTRQGKEHGANR
mmetsp:Transcript_53115/g.99534  ORF Transcript_53115/g.99534 Transcript_53115/m.99534 type:complete len:246 (-) Transcript_53115:30-767(-)